MTECDNAMQPIASTATNVFILTDFIICAFFKVNIKSAIALKRKNNENYSVFKVSLVFSRLKNFS